MSRADWLPAFFDRLVQHDLTVTESPALTPARRVRVPSAGWGVLAQQARAWGCRWVGTWGDDDGHTLSVTACLEKDGQYLCAHTGLDRDRPELPSQTPHFPAADRPERHLRDLYGVAFADHPDPRRWTRHQAWRTDEFPLRKGFPPAGRPLPVTPADHLYPCVPAQGGGVYEVVVGPVHAGIIEPGHFRFQAAGEAVLNLEQRLGYTHKGIEKIAEGRDAEGLARLAGRVSGDATVAHAWAACQAMERAAGLAVPGRASYLRAILSERERVANHLNDIGAVCNDVGFAFPFYQLGRLREHWLRTNRRAFGHRLLMDRIVPGGVAADLSPEAIMAMRAETAALRAEFAPLMIMITEQASLEDRLAATGYLAPDLATLLGTLGYVGRASGSAYDMRRDAPYPPYDRLTVPVPVFHYGDVAARVRVRAEEIVVALDLIDALLAQMPAGATRAAWVPPAGAAEGLGLIEGWRGEVLAYVRFGDDGRVARYYPRDPSLLNWPALEKLTRDNIIPDFPVCNKSVNGSYSGADL